LPWPSCASRAGYGCRAAASSWLRGADHALLDYIEAVARHGLDWLAEHLPVEAEGTRTRLGAEGRAAVDA